MLKAGAVKHPTSWGIRGAIIQSPRDIAALAMTLRSPFFESFKVAYLDIHGKVLHSKIVSIGILNATIAHPREVFRETPEGTAGVILSHNHPSGNTRPSTEDFKITQMLRASGEILGIPVIDHVITNGHFLSMRNEAAQVKANVNPFINASPQENLWKTRFLLSTYGNEREGNLNHVAPWENVPRDQLFALVTKDKLRQLADAMRLTPDGVEYVHTIMLTTDNAVMAVWRSKGETFNPYSVIRESLRHGGVDAFALDLRGLPEGRAITAARQTMEVAHKFNITFLDALYDQGSGSMRRNARMDFETQSPMPASPSLGQSAQSFSVRRLAGRPDLSQISPDERVRNMVRTVHLLRDQAGLPTPEKEAEWVAAAEQRYAADPEKARKAVLSGEMDYAGNNSGADTKLTQMVITDLGVQAFGAGFAGDPLIYGQVGAAIWSYINKGSNIARAMRARADPNESPGARNRRYVIEHLFAPSWKLSKAMEGMTPEERIRAVAEEALGPNAQGMELDGSPIEQSAQMQRKR